MSYINKPGKTRAWCTMVTRQQISDVLTHHQIVTTLTKAKITQKYLERLITLAKVDSVTNRRKAARTLLTTKAFDRDELVKYLFTKIAPRFKSRAGGYTRVVKTGSRRGDAAEEAVLQFVVSIPAVNKKVKKTETLPKKEVSSTKKAAAPATEAVQTTEPKVVASAQATESKQK